MATIKFTAEDFAASKAKTVVTVERVGNREYRLNQNFVDGFHSVESQPINVKTGKAWQATTYILRSRDCTTGFQALNAFNRAIAKARGEG